MSFHKEVDEINLAWRENRDRINHELRLVMKRVSNKVLSEFDEEFTAALAEGKVLELQPSPNELKRRLLERVQLALTE